MCVGVWNLFIFMHAFSAGFASALNIPISARLWDEETEHSLHGCHSHPEFSLHIRAHLRRGWSTERRVKRSPHKHMRVSEIRGMRVGGWDGEQQARMKQLRRWRRWLPRAGFRESDRGKMDFFFAFAAEHNTYQSFLPVCGYFQSLLLLPLGARCPPPLFTRSSLLYSFSPVLPLHSPPSSTELWLENTGHSNDPISSLFTDFRPLSPLIRCTSLSRLCFLPLCFTLFV